MILYDDRRTPKGCDYYNLTLSANTCRKNIHKDRNAKMNVCSSHAHGEKKCNIISKIKTTYVCPKHIIKLFLFLTNENKINHPKLEKCINILSKKRLTDCTCYTICEAQVFACIFYRLRILRYFATFSTKYGSILSTDHSSSTIDTYSVS